MSTNGGFRFDFTGDDSIVAEVNSYRLDQRSFNDACEFLRTNVIGSDTVIQTPFGNRQLLYADYTASGRLLKCIEEYIQREVLPYYGNTHTLSSFTGSQTTFFRIEARQIIKQYLNANHEDALIFCGSGSTTAVQKFISIMQRSLWNLRIFDSISNSEILPGRQRDEFFREDRWGSCECRLCGIRLKNEFLYRAHQHSDEHQRRLNDCCKTISSSIHQSTDGKLLQNPTVTPASVIQRLIVFICDPTAHHSLSLPFREMVKMPQLNPGHFIQDNEDIRNKISSVSVSFDFVELKIDPVTCTFDRNHLELELMNCRVLQRKADQIGEVHFTQTNNDQPIQAAYHFDVIPVCILSAGSNVTGLQVNVVDINEVIHSFNGIACWDFAAVSAHSQIDFNPPNHPNGLIDVGFFSPHKLLGGPASPGMLVIKKGLLHNLVPSVPGGGVVFYVSRNGQSYINNTEEREEAGTPDILGDIRAGLVYRLHSQLSSHDIAKRESAFVEYLIRYWGKHKRIHLLGPLGIDPSPETSVEYLNARMGIICFMIKYGNNLVELQNSNTNHTGIPCQASTRGGLYLHHHFIVVLLNDLFGIQVRGGCLCAGPLAQFLLGLNEQQIIDFEKCLEKTGQEVFRPGFVRASVHYCMNWDDIELLCQAVLWIADFGWKFLPAYTFVPETGEWEHRVIKPRNHRRWLSGLTLMNQKGVGMTAVVDSRMGQQGKQITNHSEKDVMLPKKDPRRIAGAVALLPGVADGDEKSLKANLITALSGLKKTSKSRPNPTEFESSSVSEFQAAILKRTARLANRPGPASASTTRTKELSSESIPGNELAEKLALRRLATEEQLQDESVKENSESQSDSKTCTGLSLSKPSISSSVTDVAVASDRTVVITPRFSIQDPNPCAETKEAVKFDIRASIPVLSEVSLKEPEPSNLKEPEPSNLKESINFKPTKMSNGLRPKSRSILAPTAKPVEPTVSGSTPSLAPEPKPGASTSKPSGFETLFISEVTPPDLEALMAVNHDLLESLYSGPRKSILSHSCNVPPLPIEFLHLLWFALPVDSAQSLLDAVPRPRLSQDQLLLLPSLDGSPMETDRPQSSCFEIRLFTPGPIDTLPALSQSSNTQVPTDYDQECVDGILEIVRGIVQPTDPKNDTRILDVLKIELLALRSKPTLTNQSELILNCSTNDVSTNRKPDEPLSSLTSMNARENGDIKVDRDGRLEVPRHLRHTVGSAIRDFNMIREGDRLLVGLSGGKDSLSLLHALRDTQKRSPVKFEIAAATVDPQTSEYNPRPLIPYVESLGIKYHFLSYPLIEMAKNHMEKNSLCAFCSRMKRGILYSCMRNHQYNVLVLGQHLDDICESFLMSALHNGSLNTMKANYTIGRGDIRVCRPLIYTREKVLAEFAKNANLPVIADNCPACFSQPRERHRIKLLLAQQEFEFPHVFQTLLHTVRPLIAVDEVDDISKRKIEDPDDNDEIIRTWQLVNNETPFQLD